MLVTYPTHEIIAPDDLETTGKEQIYSQIERAARTCYKGADSQSVEARNKFIANLVKSGHEAMLEHAFITVKFRTDRGVSHEIVRHREASYAQESTRYCNYSKEKFGNELTFMSIGDALATDEKTKELDVDAGAKILVVWYDACKYAEKCYMKMLQLGATPQIARSVLNNSVQTELVMTANIREWRHVLKLRAAGTTGKPHPQMKELMMPLLDEFAEIMPELFGDIKEEMKN